MLKQILFLSLLLISRIGSAQTGDYFNAPFGELLEGSTGKVGLWWASSVGVENKPGQIPAR